MTDSVELGSTHPLVDGRTASAPIILAYQGIRPATTPVWFMRQAGRSLPEYRRVRADIPMLEACLQPELVTEITLQPVSRHGVDAAIFFSDIVVPLRLAGVGVDIVAGVGPVVADPVRSAQGARRLPELDPQSLAPITEAVNMVTERLGHTPLIGFAGAPFTLASYLIEGRPSRDYAHTKALMRADPQTFHDVLAWVARTTGAFLRAQALAGASAVQLFDSWAGALTLDEYTTFAAPHSAAAFAAVADLPVPRVHFGTHTRHLLCAMRDAGGTVMGIDQFTPLDEAVEILGGATAVQGNVDPELLSADWALLSEHVVDVVERGRKAPGHVVNLGHGVPPSTDPDVLTRIVELVHAQT